MNKTQLQLLLESQRPLSTNAHEQLFSVAEDTLNIEYSQYPAPGLTKITSEIRKIVELYQQGGWEINYGEKPGYGLVDIVMNDGTEYQSVCGDSIVFNTNCSRYPALYRQHSEELAPWPEDAPDYATHLVKYLPDDSFEYIEVEDGLPSLLDEEDWVLFSKRPDVKISEKSEPKPSIDQQEITLDIAQIISLAESAGLTVEHSSNPDELEVELTIRTNMKLIDEETKQESEPQTLCWFTELPEEGAFALPTAEESQK